MEQSRADCFDVKAMAMIRPEIWSSPSTSRKRRYAASSLIDRIGSIQEGGSGGVSLSLSLSKERKTKGEGGVFNLLTQAGQALLFLLPRLIKLLPILFCVKARLGWAGLAKLMEGATASSSSSAPSRNLDPGCVNASNPYHRCTDKCSRRTTDGRRRRAKVARTDQNGVRNQEGRMVAEKRNADPMCSNASNPYHQCANYCSKRTPEARRQNRGTSVQNGEGSKEKGRVVGKGRNADPMCANASNPYHKCMEYCGQKSSEARRQTGGNKSGSVEVVKMLENMNVDIRCASASNPHHKCTEHCFQKSREMVWVEEGHSEESKGAVKVERRDVNPKCGYRSNPYHICTDHCLQRIQEAM